MTDDECRMATAIAERVTFLPASNDKAFARYVAGLVTSAPGARTLTNKQGEYLRQVVQRYRRQLPSEIVALATSEGDSSPALPSAPVLTREPDLFTESAPRARAYSAGSSAAAAKIAPHAKSLRETVYEFIVSCGARGATRAEVVGGTHIKENSVNGRCHELLTQEPLRVVERGTRNDRAILVAVNQLPSDEREAALLAQRIQNGRKKGAAA